MWGRTGLHQLTYDLQTLLMFFLHPGARDLSAWDLSAKGWDRQKSSTCCFCFKSTNELHVSNILGRKCRTLLISVVDIQPPLLTEVTTHSLTVFPDYTVLPLIWYITGHCDFFDRNVLFSPLLHLHLGPTFLSTATVGAIATGNITTCYPYYWVSQLHPQWF